MTILEALIQVRDDLKAWVVSNLKVKVDVEYGKGLSTNDYTTAEKEKLAALSVDKVNNLSALVGRTAVSTQISNAVAQKSQVQIITWEADD